MSPPATPRRVPAGRPRDRPAAQPARPSLDARAQLPGVQSLPAGRCRALGAARAGDRTPPGRPCRASTAPRAPRRGRHVIGVAERHQALERLARRDVVAQLIQAAVPCAASPRLGRVGAVALGGGRSASIRSSSVGSTSSASTIAASTASRRSAWRPRARPPRRARARSCRRSAGTSPCRSPAGECGERLLHHLVGARVHQRVGHLDGRRCRRPPAARPPRTRARSCCSLGLAQLGGDVLAQLGERVELGGLGGEVVVELGQALGLDLVTVTSKVACLPASSLGASPRGR